jgi:hypothetical protein
LQSSCKNTCTSKKADASVSDSPDDSPDDSPTDSPDATVSSFHFENSPDYRNTPAGSTPEGKFSGERNSNGGNTDTNGNNGDGVDKNSNVGGGGKIQNYSNDGVGGGGNSDKGEHRGTEAKVKANDEKSKRRNGQQKIASMGSLEVDTSCGKGDRTSKPCDNHIQQNTPCADNKADSKVRMKKKRGKIRRNGEPALLGGDESESGDQCGDQSGEARDDLDDGEADGLDDWGSENVFGDGGVSKTAAEQGSADKLKGSADKLKHPGKADEQTNAKTNENESKTNAKTKTNTKPNTNAKTNSAVADSVALAGSGFGFHAPASDLPPEELEQLATQSDGGITVNHEDVCGDNDDVYANNDDVNNDSSNGTSINNDREKDEINNGARSALGNGATESGKYATKSGATESGAPESGEADIETETVTSIWKKKSKRDRQRELDGEQTYSPELPIDKRANGEMEPDSGDSTDSGDSSDSDVDCHKRDSESDRHKKGSDSGCHNRKPHGSDCHRGDCQNSNGDTQNSTQIFSQSAGRVGSKRKLEKVGSSGRLSVGAEVQKTAQGTSTTKRRTIKTRKKLREEQKLREKEAENEVSNPENQASNPQDEGSDEILSLEAVQMKLHAILSPAEMALLDSSFSAEMEAAIAHTRNEYEKAGGGEYKENKGGELHKANKAGEHEKSGELEEGNAMEVEGVLGSAGTAAVEVELESTASPKTAAELEAEIGRLRSLEESLQNLKETLDFRETDLLQKEKKRERIYNKKMRRAEDIMCRLKLGKKLILNISLDSSIENSKEKMMVETEARKLSCKFPISRYCFN